MFQPSSSWFSKFPSLIFPFLKLSTFAENIFRAARAARAVKATTVPRQYGARTGSRALFLGNSLLLGQGVGTNLYLSCFLHGYLHHGYWFRNVYTDWYRWSCFEKDLQPTGAPFHAGLNVYWLISCAQRCECYETWCSIWCSAGFRLKAPWAF